jgi:hypothetical protein
MWYMQQKGQEMVRKQSEQDGRDPINIADGHCAPDTEESAVRSMPCYFHGASSDFADQPEVRALPRADRLPEPRYRVQTRSSMGRPIVSLHLPSFLDVSGLASDSLLHLSIDQSTAALAATSLTAETAGLSDQLNGRIRKSNSRGRRAPLDDNCPTGWRFVR